jgi:hypothetical protein
MPYGFGMYFTRCTQDAVLLRVTRFFFFSFEERLGKGGGVMRCDSYWASAFRVWLL